MLPDIESCGNSRLFSAPSEQLHKRGFSTVFWARIWPAEGPLLPLTLRLSSVILQLASGGTGHQKYDLKDCVLGLRIRSGSSSGVERKLPKLDVAGSTPVSRSKFSAFPPFPRQTRCHIPFPGMWANHRVNSNAHAPVNHLAIIWPIIDRRPRVMVCRSP